MRNVQRPRREELLGRIVEYLLEHGVSDLSLRPLAAGVGTHARMLIYHFGSREQLVSSALEVVLGRAQGAFLAMRESDSLEVALRRFWKAATDEAHRPYLRLLLEVHTRSLQDDGAFSRYRRGSIVSWTRLVDERLRARIRSPRRRQALATLVVAVIDGLLLDFLATGDRARTTRALEAFTSTLHSGTGDSP